MFVCVILLYSRLSLNHTQSVCVRVHIQIACKRYINVCIWLEPFDFGYR